MHCKNQLNINLRIYAVKPQMFSLFFILIFSLSAIVIHSQELEYTIKGRVVGDNGQPSSKADIRVAPIKYVMEYNVLTNKDGNFSITKRIKKGDTWYFYVAQDSKYSLYHEH